LTVSVLYCNATKAPPSSTGTQWAVTEAVIVHSLSSRTVLFNEYSTMRFRAQACDYHMEAMSLLHEARRGPVPTIWIHETPHEEDRQENELEEDEDDDIESEGHVEAQGESLRPVLQQTYDTASNEERSEKSFSRMLNGASSSVNSGSTAPEEAQKSRSLLLSPKVLSTRSKPCETPMPVLQSSDSPGSHSDGSETLPTVASLIDMTKSNEALLASEIINKGQAPVEEAPPTGPFSALHLLHLASHRPAYQEETASIEKSEYGTPYFFDERSTTSSETEVGDLVS
jgi:hypothetical protein